LRANIAELGAHVTTSTTRLFGALTRGTTTGRRSRTQAFHHWLTVDGKHPTSAAIAAGFMHDRRISIARSRCASEYFARGCFSPFTPRSPPIRP
jgi:hypothetical protein